MTGPGGLATRTHVEMAACGCARGNLGTNCDRVAEPYERDESGAYTMRPQTLHRQWLHWWQKNAGNFITISQIRRSSIL
jgi:hypothetical protein